MRLDKYLKVSRLVKRRTLAQELCAGARCKVNGRIAKPASDVGPGDELEISFGARRLVVRVVAVAEHAAKDQATSLYELISETRAEAESAFGEAKPTARRGPAFEGWRVEEAEEED